MVTVRTEPYLFYGGFQSTFVDLNINRNMRLEEVTKRISNLNFGGTDASIPVSHALKNKMPVDVFAIYTDSETYGSRHVYQGLQEYRQKTGINAKMVVVGMTATHFTIADPNDPGMLDVVGFDINTPNVISQFVK
jgi:60 kDa SS-A/Ro ribonucleoprotein